MPTESYYVVQRSPTVAEYWGLQDGGIWTRDASRASRYSRDQCHRVVAGVMMSPRDQGPDCLVRKAVKRTVERPGRSGWVVRDRHDYYWGRYVWGPDLAATSVLHRDEAAEVFVKYGAARSIEHVTLPGETVTEWTVVGEFEEVEDG